MQLAGRPGVKLALGAATAVVVVGEGMLATGTASARPVSLTLNYTCHVPVAGGWPVTARARADVPSSDTVGEPTQPIPITVTATVSGLFTAGLHMLGVHSIEGTAVGKVTVSAPQRDIGVSLPLTIARTTVPASGSFRVPVTGLGPSLTFTRPGNGKITVGDINLHLAGRDADGRPKGRLDLPCTLDSKQNDVIGSFIVRPRPTAKPTSGTTPPAATPTRRTAPGTSKQTVPGVDRSPARGSAAARDQGPAASGSAALPAHGGPPTVGPGRTAMPVPNSASATKATSTAAADSTFVEAGSSTRHTKAPVMLAVGGCAAAAGAVGFGALLWRRHHAGNGDR